MAGTRRGKIVYRVLLGVALLLACGFSAAGGYQLAFLLHPEFNRSVIGYQEYTLCMLLLLVLPCVVFGSIRPRAGQRLLWALAAASSVQALLVIRLAVEGLGAGTLAFALAEATYTLLTGWSFAWRAGCSGVK